MCHTNRHHQRGYYVSCKKNEKIIYHWSKCQIIYSNREKYIAAEHLIMMMMVKINVRKNDKRTKQSSYELTISTQKASKQRQYLFFSDCFFFSFRRINKYRKKVMNQIKITTTNIINVHTHIIIIIHVLVCHFGGFFFLYVCMVRSKYHLYLSTHNLQFSSSS